MIGVSHLAQVSGHHEQLTVFTVGESDDIPRPGEGEGRPRTRAQQDVAGAAIVDRNPPNDVAALVRRHDDEEVLTRTAAQAFDADFERRPMIARNMLLAQDGETVRTLVDGAVGRRYLLETRSENADVGVRIGSGRVTGLSGGEGRGAEERQGDERGEG